MMVFDRVFSYTLTMTVRVLIISNIIHNFDCMKKKPVFNGMMVTKYHLIDHFSSRKSTLRGKPIILFFNFKLRIYIEEYI